MNNFNIVKGYKIGPHSFAEISMNEFLKIPPIPMNRDSHLRVKKMQKDFDNAYNVGREDCLTEVVIGFVQENFTDPSTGIEYKIGDWFCIDGNTRQNYWKEYPNKAEQHQTITAKIHELYNIDDANFYYYSYDNVKSVEKSTEILQGLKNRYNWVPRNNVFNTGAYTTALDWASRTPGEVFSSVHEKFDICFDSLKILDSIGKNSTHSITSPAHKGLKSQAILAACILALRYYPKNTTLHDLIDRLATITSDNMHAVMGGGKLDAVEIIACEYMKKSYQRIQDCNDINNGWLQGFVHQTKFDSQVPQMDFLMHHIQKYIENPNQKWDWKNIKPKSWKDAWDNFHPNETDEIMANLFDLEDTENDKDYSIRDNLIKSKLRAVK